jgi:hypothetical protein
VVHKPLHTKIAQRESCGLPPIKISRMESLLLPPIKISRMESLLAGVV